MDATAAAQHRSSVGWYLPDNPSRQPRARSRRLADAGPEPALPRLGSPLLAALLQAIWPKRECARTSQQCAQRTGCGVVGALLPLSLRPGKPEARPFACACQIRTHSKRDGTLDSNDDPSMGPSANNNPRLGVTSAIAWAEASRPRPPSAPYQRKACAVPADRGLLLLPKSERSRLNNRLLVCDARRRRFRVADSHQQQQCRRPGGDCRFPRRCLQPSGSWLAFPPRPGYRAHCGSELGREQSLAPCQEQGSHTAGRSTVLDPDADAEVTRAATENVGPVP